MRRRLLSYILSAVLLLLPTSTYALNTITVSNAPGEKEFTVDGTNAISRNDAVIDGGNVTISAGGSVTFGFYLPYNVRAVKIVFTNANGDLNINMGENTYKAEGLSGNGEHTIEFATAMGYEMQYENKNRQNYRYLPIEFCEHRGEKEVVVSSTGNITISKLLFEKEKTVTWKNYNEPAISEDEYTMLSTVLMDTRSSVIVVNGGKRYISNDDTTMRPYNYNGSIYLPINTLAKALGYYHEDQPSKGYALLRSETHEVVMLGNRLTVSEGMAAPKDVPCEAIIYRDGITMAQVRYFAELGGDTVGFKDGFVAIDDKYTVAKILNTDSILKTATSKLSAFRNKAEKGKTYHVAQTTMADDNNNGSENAPFRSLKKAGEVAQAGDTVIIHKGIYRETLAPQNNGTATAPITFKAAEDEEVVISANDVLEDFMHYEGDIYVAAMPKSLGDGRNQIFMPDGTMLTEARYPNGPDKRVVGELSEAWPVRGDFYVDPADNNLVKSDTMLWQKDKDYWKGATFVGRFGLAYTLAMGKIVGSSEGQLEISPTDRSYSVWNSSNAPVSESAKYNEGYIVGHMNALDIPGEWVLKGNNLYMILPEGTDPVMTDFEIKQRQLVIDLNDKKYINIMGIKTIGGSARMGDKSEMCMLNGMDMKYISHFTNSYDQYYGFIDIPENSGETGAPIRGEVGIYIDGTDNILVNSTIDHSAGAAVYGTGLYTYIENNVMSNCGYMSNYASGIHFGTLPWETISTPRGGYGIFNNDVYNCGRGAIDFSEGAYVVNGQSVRPHGSQYLPSEIAYNSFHDAMLYASDGGAIYSYGTELTVREHETKNHHNYVYTTISGVDIANDYNATYHDGVSHGMYLSNIVAFYTQPDGHFRGPWHWSAITNNVESSSVNWNMYELGYVPEGVDGLTSEMFTEERAFHAGTLKDLANYTLNYDRFIGGRFGAKYAARDAEVFAGAVINKQTGYAEFTGDNQYIRFKNVDFGTESNRITLSMKGDRNYTYDDMEIIIGDFEKGTRYTFEAWNLGPDFENINSQQIEIQPISGVHDVYVKVNEYHSTKVGALSVYSMKRLLDEEYEVDKYAYFEYAGNFTESVKFDENASGNKPSESYHSSERIDPWLSFLSGTGPGNYVLYSGRSISEATDTLAIAAASDAQWGHQPIEVYLDSLSGEPVASFNVQNDGWNPSPITVVPLNKEVLPGTYDIYLKFAGKEYGLSSDIRFFGFLKKDEIPSDTNYDLTKVFGGNYDKELSVSGNEGFPLSSRWLHAPDFESKVLVYTLPNTVVAYKDVEVKADSSKFTIRYATKNGFDGQQVDIYIDDPAGTSIGSFTTEGTSFDEYKEVTIELNTPVSGGKHNVYLSFGGDKDSRQTCKVDWFAFDN